jgi:hypothetical protein
VKLALKVPPAPRVRLAALDPPDLSDPQVLRDRPGLQVRLALKVLPESLGPPVQLVQSDHRDPRE